MPKESTKATITSFAGTPLVRVVDGSNSRNISPANLVAESGARAALDSRYSPLAGPMSLPGLRWAFLGDSITNGSSASNASYSFPYQAVDAAGHFVARRDFHEAGTSGETSTQIAARIATVLAYSGVEGLVVLAGTNDATGVSAVATFATNMTTILTAARKAGVPVVVCTVPPRGSGAAAAAHYAILGFNQWIKTNVRRMGAQIADVNAALVDQTTGYLAAAYDSGDGIHPNTLGHMVMATPVAEAMRRAADLDPVALVVADDGGSIVTTDPLVVGSSGKPVSWLEHTGGTGATPTYSIVSNDGTFCPVGNWAQVDIDASAAAATTRRLRNPLISSGMSANDRVVMTGFIEVDDVSSDWAANVATGDANVSLAVLNSSVITQEDTGRRIGRGEVGGTYRLGPFLFPFDYDWGTNTYFWMNMKVPAGSHYTFRLGNPALVNVTTISATAVFSDYGAVVNH